MLVLGFMEFAKDGSMIPSDIENCIPREDLDKAMPTLVERILEAVDENPALKKDRERLIHKVKELQEDLQNDIKAYEKSKLQFYAMLLLGQTVQTSVLSR